MIHEITTYEDRWQTFLWWDGQSVWIIYQPELPNMGVL